MMIMIIMIIPIIMIILIIMIINYLSAGSLCMSRYHPIFLFRSSFDGLFIVNSIPEEFDKHIIGRSIIENTASLS